MGRPQGRLLRSRVFIRNRYLVVIRPPFQYVGLDPRKSVVRVHPGVKLIWVKPTCSHLLSQA